METTPSRALEVVPVRQGAPEEDVRGQAEGGDGLRKASETVALVCAGALAGGGAGMLAGVALGAINPYALGIVGVVGIGVPVLFMVGARRATQRPWWRRVLGG